MRLTFSEKSWCFGCKEYKPVIELDYECEYPPDFCATCLKTALTALEDEVRERERRGEK